MTWRAPDTARKVTKQRQVRGTARRRGRTVVRELGAGGAGTGIGVGSGSELSDGMGMTDDNPFLEVSTRSGLVEEVEVLRRMSGIPIDVPDRPDQDDDDLDEDYNKLGGSSDFGTVISLDIRLATSTKHHDRTL